jgi:uncharacterized membrane protein
MEGVEEVQQLDDKRLHWIAQLGGKRKEWDAEIFEQVPDETIAWRSVGGARNSGVVTFSPLGSDRTEVRLRLNYEPEGVMENVGDMLGVVGKRVEGDLERFKDFIQTRQEETGAWRGEIHHGQPTSGQSSAEPRQGSSDGRGFSELSGGSSEASGSWGSSGNIPPV